MSDRYFEDLQPGQVFPGGRHIVTLAEILAFAGQFDPQPFHLDPEAAKHTLFGELVASGWHTMAITMRLIVDGESHIAGGYIGLGVEALQWPNPTRPGDSLRAESEVLEITPSRTKADRGTARIRTTTFNQRDEPVLIVTARLVVPRRTATPP